MAPLSGIRVIEWAALPAASYAARLLADFGAEVILAGPVAGRGTDDFAFLHFGKQATDAALPDLLPGADVLVTSRAPNEALVHPGLVVADISWFGRTGPYAGFAGADLVARALAGLVQPIGPAEGPPLVAPDFQALAMGGTTGAVAILAALMARRRGAAGRVLELSIHEACIAYAELQTADSLARGTVLARQGVNRFWPTFPVGIHRARDGWLGVTLITPAQWRGFCRLAGLDDLADDPDLATVHERVERAAELEARFVPKLLERSTAEWFALALAHRLPIVPVPDMEGVLADAEFRARGAIVPVQDGTRCLEAPGNPWRLTRTPPRRGGAVPAPGGPPPALRAPVPSGTADGRPMLAGLRVVDLSMGWAGPLASRLLADLGAEVIKIEACQYPDWWRGVDFRPHVLEQRLYEKTGRFNALNRNKRGITLDLTRPEGVAAARALVAGADAVVENYAAGVLAKLGLDWAALSAVNPGLVMLSMCAFGDSSARRELRAYGSTLEHASGLPTLAGRAGDPPVMGHIAFGDATGGLNGAAALLVALLHRQATGEGQHIDLSQVECMLPMAAPALMAASAGRSWPRDGNRHPAHRPHGIFRCAGDDAWIAVACTDDVMRARLATLAGAATEAALDAWTAGRSPADAMAGLQAVGIAAGIALPPLALFDDPHLAARGFWQRLDRPFIGAFPQSSLPFREAAQPYPIATPAPTLGQHTEDVLRDILAYADDRIAGLKAAGIIGTEVMPARS